MHRSPLRQSSQVVLIVLASLAFLGCKQGNESGLSDAQEKAGNDVNAWAKATGGDWEKLSAQQKATMIKNVGSEASAKMVLKFSAHKPDPINPGPPPGWKAGGPPPSQGTQPPTGQ